MIDYKVFLTSSSKARGLKKTSKACTIVIEPEDFNREQVSDLKKKGYNVLGYLNVGAIEDTRSYYNQLKPYRIQKNGKPYQLDDWPHEWWIDIRRTRVRDFLVNRAKEIKKLGCDGFWCDNIDIYEYNKSDAMFEAITSILRRLKALNGYVMLNGGYKYLQEYMNKEMSGGVYKVQVGAFSVFANAYATMQKLMAIDINCFIVLEGSTFTERKLSDFVDGVTQEEVFTLIKDYSGKGKFGNQESNQSK